MNRSNPLLLVALLGAPAFAQTVYVDVPSGVDLMEVRASGGAGGDLTILDSTIDAPNGIKLEGVEEFSPTAPVVVDTPYLVKARNGNLFRVWVHGTQGMQRRVEVKPVVASNPSATPTSALQGRFHQTACRILGEPAESSYPDLRLYSDGTFRLGAASGRWDREATAVVLDGHYGSWGQGEVSDQGRTITFTFTRGKLSFELTYTRVADLDDLASAMP